MELPGIGSVDLAQRRVLIRVDFNVPIENGNVSNAARIEAALPTIRAVHNANAAVILVSHLGRPEPNDRSECYSLAPVVKYLSDKLAKSVELVSDYNKALDINPGDIVLLENIRFEAGEQNNSPELAQRLAALCDIFVLDAFGCAHREHASTVGIIRYAACSVAGSLLAREVRELDNFLTRAKPPMVGIVGGAKVSTKLVLLKKLSSILDVLVLGGGIANTFLAAKGYDVGSSLYERDLTDLALEVLEHAEKNGCNICLPEDVIVTKDIQSARGESKLISDILPDDKIVDVGKKSVAKYSSYIDNAKTILWNGPVGIFEIDAFTRGTESVAKAVAIASAHTIAGGGDTLAAIYKYGIAANIDYISTGGGAFLEYIEGKELPAIKMLSNATAVI